MVKSLNDIDNKNREGEPDFVLMDPSEVIGLLEGLVVSFYLQAIDIGKLAQITENYDGVTPEGSVSYQALLGKLDNSIDSEIERIEGEIKEQVVLFRQKGETEPMEGTLNLSVADIQDIRGWITSARNLGYDRGRTLAPPKIGTTDTDLLKQDSVFEFPKKPN